MKILSLDRTIFYFIRYRCVPGTWTLYVENQCKSKFSMLRKPCLF